MMNATSKTRVTPPKNQSLAALHRKSTYQVQGKKFIVTPIFAQTGSETLGSVLLKLMKNEITNC